MPRRRFLTKYRIFTWFVVSLLNSICWGSAPPLKVLTTFTVLKDWVKEIGGDRVCVQSIVGPDSDPHVYELKPSDIKKVSDSDLVFVNGLGFEGWIERLSQVQKFAKKMSTVSTYIHPRLVFEGTLVPDPHIWHSLPNAKICVRNIFEALVKKDPTSKVYYEKRFKCFLDKLTQLDIWIRQLIDEIPPERRKIITAHDAFGYFGNAYGVQFLAPQGISTDSEPRVRAVVQLIEQIKKMKVKIIFVENISDSKIIQQIGRETEAEIGGVLYADSLSEVGGVADTYIKMIQHNVALFLKAMRA